MAIDIRARVTCSLGNVISASISDDYIQGAGLIKTSGSCEISGLITPSIGTVVTFSYSKDGITRTVPRRLRVLSSFADPFRRTTKVELGCKLTYLQDVKESLDWSGLDDPENADLEEADSKIVTVPIRAQSIANECCSRLGITPSGLFLSNVFSIEEFDFSAGYVSILSDLLVSECKCGYMNASEVLEIFSLSAIGGSGPVLDSSRIIDIGSIGVGSLPGDAVTVSYSSLKLKVPDDEEVVCRLADEEEEEEEEEEVSTWGTDLVTSSSPAQATIGYKRNGEGDLLFSTFGWMETSRETTFYKVYTLREPGYTWKPGGAPEKYTRKNLVSRRVITLGSGSASIAGGYAQQRLANGFGFNSFDVFKQSVEVFSYDVYGNETRRELTTYGSLLYLYGGAGIDFVYENEDGSKSVVNLGQATGSLERITVKTTRSGNTVKTVTKRYGPWAETIPGQQAIASAREDITSAGEAEAFLAFAYGGLYLIDVTVNTSKTGSRDPEELPTEGEVLTERLAEDSGDPDNGFSTESAAEIELASGSSFGTRRIELSMPYAPDDTFSRKTVSTDPLRYCFFSVRSDAPSKAKAFGVAQNRLLYGNRNGMNVQTTPEYLPGAPFSAVTVQANGLSAMYRTNGTGWTMDSNGIVVSSDLLFMGAVGGTGDFWFPVAPGVTTLPTTPPVVDTTPTQVIGSETSLGEDPVATLVATYPAAISGDGVFDEETQDFWTYDGADWTNVGPTPGPTIEVDRVVPPWNETVLLTGRIRTKVEVQSLAYALNVETAVDPYGITVGMTAVRVLPVATIGLAAAAPAVSTGASVAAPAAATALAGAAPAVAGGASVATPAADVALAAISDIIAGRPKTQIIAPTGLISLAGTSPVVAGGASVNTSTLGIALAGNAPDHAGRYTILVGSYINSDSTSDTSHVLNAPTHAEGDLLVAVLMWRANHGGITAPSGWTLYGTYTSSIVFSGVQQNLLVYTKTATGSEPTSYTWTAVSAARNCGLIAAIRNGSIETVNESYGQAATATINTAANRLNLTVFTWIYAISTSTESYSQSASAGTFTEISDSPKAAARLSGGYTSDAATITSTHQSGDTGNSPNHGGICISFG